MFTVKIRDGRVGRDAQRVGSDGRGEVLMAYDTTVEALQAVDIGSIVTLPDGTSCPVIGVDDEVDNSTGTWVRHAAVGNG